MKPEHKILYGPRLDRSDGPEDGKSHARAARSGAYPPQALRERWKALLSDDTVPDRCELDAYGAVLVNPSPTFAHQLIVRAIERQLEAALGGTAGSFAVLTQAGVLLPDVCWSADIGAIAALGEDPLARCPEVCVEVVSPGNRREALNEKAAACLAAGCQKVIVVELDGRIRYLTAAGEQPTSRFGLALALPEGSYPRKPT